MKNILCILGLLLAGSILFSCNKSYSCRCIKVGGSQLYDMGNVSEGTANSKCSNIKTTDFWDTCNVVILK